MFIRSFMFHTFATFCLQINNRIAGFAISSNNSSIKSKRDGSIYISSRIIRNVVFHFKKGVR